MSDKSSPPTFSLFRPLLCLDIYLLGFLGRFAWLQFRHGYFAQMNGEAVRWGIVRFAFTTIRVKIYTSWPLADSCGIIKNVLMELLVFGA